MMMGNIGMILSAWTWVQHVKIFSRMAGCWKSGIRAVYLLFVMMRMAFFCVQVILAMFVAEVQLTIIRHERWEWTSAKYRVTSDLFLRKLFALFIQHSDLFNLVQRIVVWKSNVRFSSRYTYTKKIYTILSFCQGVCWNNVQFCLLKEQCHEIFRVRFFSSNNFSWSQ